MLCNMLKHAAYLGVHKIHCITLQHAATAYLKAHEMHCSIHLALGDDDMF